MPSKTRFSWKGVLGALAVGLLVHRVMFLTLLPASPLLWMKARGGGPDCPWPRVLSMTQDVQRFNALLDSYRARTTVKSGDAQLGIVLAHSVKGDFWIRKNGEKYDGPGLLAYLQAEHDWIAGLYPDHSVRKGDIVIDCGAHVGIFTHKALERGAAKVIAIEPEPVNAQCLRRNFSPEISAGRVLVVEKGVWSKPGSLELSLGASNSGTGSMVRKDGEGDKVTVPVDTLDHIVAELGLPRVDFIKMDIEGAEREALRGAMATLKTHRPRLMLDSYHLPDDALVLPAVIRQAHPDYIRTCGPCELSENQLHAHTTFYR